ncbi:MAG: hypothetical protein EBY16_06270 [Gammaproteobacteria bacterium]|nr:hypothetical protein [Gammaproteobacteria bacterium]
MNTFHQIVGTLLTNETLKTDLSVSKVSRDGLPYIMLKLPSVSSDKLILNQDVTCHIDEHHITIFQNYDHKSGHSAYHYTATLQSSDGCDVYRLRVFFNSIDQPKTVGWSRKMQKNSDDLFLRKELTPREIEITMDFAVEKIKSSIDFIRSQQQTQVGSAKERYQSLYSSFDQLIQDQVPGVKFDITQALIYLEGMKQSLCLQEALGIRRSRDKWALITRLEALINFTPQPIIKKEVVETQTSALVEIDLDESLPVAPTQEVKVLAVSRPKLNLRAMEEMFSAIDSKQSEISALREHTKLLSSFDDLKEDYRRCCEMYLEIMGDTSAVSELKQFTVLNDRMALIEQNQVLIEAKYVQTLLTFGEQTDENMKRLRSCQSAIESLMKSLVMKNVKLLIKNNKSQFLQLILEYKQFTTAELVNIMKAIFSYDRTECLDEVLTRYRIHSLLLEKDSENILLASYLFRLPFGHKLREALWKKIPALSSEAFYEKLNIELNKSKCEQLYDQISIVHDIECALMAKSLYAISSEQKYQMREAIELERQLPLSIKRVLRSKTSFSLDSPWVKKMTFAHEMYKEINQTMACLGTEFQQLVKKQIKSKMKQFKFEIFEQEKIILAELETIGEAELEKSLDSMIKFCHLLNNFLLYCLPIRMNGLSERAHTDLREYYFRQLQTFGMDTNPYDELNAIVSRLSENIKKLEELLSIIVGQKPDTQAFQPLLEAESIETRLACESYPAVSTTKLIEDDGASAIKALGTALTPFSSFAGKASTLLLEDKCTTKEEATCQLHPSLSP